MFAVTIDALPGYEIKEVIGGVVGITARSQNVFLEGVKALSGAPNPQVSRTLSRWRQEAIARMVETAYSRGANAVIGVRFDHRSIGASWTEICAYGTAVFVVPAGRVRPPQAEQTESR
jgi:uncharacterized protein YbjQ (UPF0145 family)